mgnify:CR=1 FL=1
MKLKRKDNSQLVIGAQAFRTSNKGRHGWEWHFNLLPVISAASRFDLLQGTRITSLHLSWLLWGVEVYAFTAKVVEVKDENESGKEG